MEPSERVRQFIAQSMGPESVRIAEALLSRNEATDTALAAALGETPRHIH